MSRPEKGSAPAGQGLGREGKAADEGNVKADGALLGTEVPSLTQCDIVGKAIKLLPADMKHGAESVLLRMLVAFLKKVPL